MIAKIRRVILAAHACATDCFNAHQESKHTKPHYGQHEREFVNAWADLPLWLRKLLIGKPR